MIEPLFPLRIIFDDGEVAMLESPDEIFEHFASIDSAAPDSRAWIRDALDRTIHVVMRDGVVERFEVI